MDLSLYALIMSKMKPIIESVKGYFIKQVDFQIDNTGNLQYKVELNTPSSLESNEQNGGD